MEEIYEGYLNENRKKLLSETELYKFLQNPKNLECYAEHGLGSNELYKYKSLSFLEKMGDLHKIAFQGARELIEDVDEGTDHYLKELFRFSLARKKNFLKTDKKAIKTFHYDFVALLKDRFQENPLYYFKPNGIRIEVVYSDSQKDIIRKYLSQFGDSVEGIGKILHRGDEGSLYRVARCI